MIINITERTFGGRIRSGDILGACNMLEHLRKIDNPNFKFYLSDDSIQNVSYVRQFRDFICENSDYLSKIPGDLQLQSENINCWDYRSLTDDLIKIDNSNYVKQNKICIFPLFDAPYNVYRNWSINLLQYLIDNYSNSGEYDEYVICCSSDNVNSINSLNLKSFVISCDFEENLKHIMSCSTFIGGETGVSLLASCLTIPPKNYYYYSSGALIHTFPFHWKTVGEIKMYSKYGWC